MYNSCFISSRFMRKFFAAGGLSSISITASVRVRRATFLVGKALSNVPGYRLPACTVSSNVFY